MTEPTDRAAAPSSAKTGFPTARMPSYAGLVAAAGVAGVLAFLLLVADALPVFIIGLIVAYLLDPVVTAMTRRGLPRGLASLAAMGGLALVLALLTVIFLDTVVSEATAFIEQLPAAFKSVEAWLASSSLPDAVKTDIQAWLDGVRNAVTSLDVTALVAPVLQGLVGLLGSFFTLLVLPFFIFYVLAGRPAI